MPPYSWCVPPISTTTMTKCSSEDTRFPFNHYDIPLHQRDDWESETSISEKSTDPDSQTSECERWVLKNRYSRPQYVDRWDIFSLKRVSSNWQWTKALSIPATDPLSEADTLFALSDILRRSAAKGSPYRMMRRKQQVDRGADGMGFKLLLDATVVIFNVSLADENILHVNKELNNETVWSKTLDRFEEMPYTSTQLLSDFMKDFNLNRGAFCETIGVLARFQVVCPKTHRLCKVSSRLPDNTR